MFKTFLPLFLLMFSVSSLRAQTVAYVTNSGSNNVSVIDTSTNTVTATIAVGNVPQGVAISPDGTRAYVPNTLDNTVSVIDTASQTVVATVPLASGSFPQFPAVTPDGKSLYVGGNSVQVVSTATNAVVATIGVGVENVAITPDGSAAYGLGESGILLITTATNTVSGPFVSAMPGEATVGTETPFGITPAGNAVYVPGGLNIGAVFVVSTATNTLSATVTLPGNNPATNSLAITPDGTQAYVADDDNNVVDIIDTATNTVESTQIPVGSNPMAVAITPDGSSVYVANLSDSTVSVISRATNTVIATVPVGLFPEDIAIANLSSLFAAFTIDNLVINNNLHEQGDFTLGSNTGGIDLAHQPLTLSVNNFSLTIPAGSFKQVGGNMHFVLNGTVNGLSVNFNIQAEHGSSTQFDFVVDVHGVNITGPDPATVGLKIGHNTGTTTAEF